MHLGSWKRVQTLTLRALQTSGTHPQLHAELCRQTINIIWRYTLVPSRAATVQIFFGSGLIFYAGFRLFRFGSSNCILFVFHIQNMYS